MGVSSLIHEADEKITDLGGTEPEAEARSMHRIFVGRVLRPGDYTDGDALVLTGL